MNYYWIQYSYKTELDVTIWRKYNATVFVQADTFEQACEKIKSQPIHKWDRGFEFVDLTIR